MSKVLMVLCRLCNQTFPGTIEAAHHFDAVHGSTGCIPPSDADERPMARCG